MSEFFPVRLNTIRANDRVPFDIFVKLAHRFVHYSAGGDEVEGERLKNLKKHGVRKLFIRPEHETLYLQYLEDGLDNLSNENLNLSERSAFAHDSLLSSAENAERNLESEEKFNGQRRQFDKIAEFLSSERKALKEILGISGLSQDLNEHSAVVSSLAVAIATKSGMDNKKEIFELGMAGLLHDIGKTRLKFDHLKPESEMTQNELRQYRNHPQDGVDMLAGKAYVSPRILKLIVSHEERGRGRGYPNKIDLFKEELPFQILSMVNCFDHFSRQNRIPSVEAIDPFFEKYGQDYDEELITVLGTVLT